MGGNIMKKNSFFSLLKGMLSLIQGKRYLIVLAVIFGTLGFLCGMGITFFGGLGILYILGMDVHMPFYLILILLVVSGFLRGVLRYGEQYLNHYMAFTLLALVRNRLFSSLRKQGSKVLDDRNKGELLSILQSDTESLEVFYAHTITPFFIAILTEAVVLILLGILTSVYFSLMALVFYLIIGALIPVIFYLSNRTLGVEYRKLLSISENEYLNSCYGMKEILYQEKEKEERKKLADVSDGLNVINRKLNTRSLTFSSITNFLIILGDIFIIFLGYLLSKDNPSFSINMILAYMMVAASFGPVVALSNLPGNLTMSFASARRILAIINEKPRVVDGSEDFSFEKLEISSLSFKYEKNEVLNDINLTLKKGEIIGIEGKSGSGKSTLFKLLLNFEKPDNGHVLYNGKDVSSYSREAISKNITLFSQSTYLFKDTIAYNLRIAKKDATVEEMDEALKKACIYDKVHSLKDGLDTMVNDLGDNFSTGERQRLGLARVFLADTPLILLDEATSNVDGYNEALILNQLKKEKDKAIILISHKKSGLSICDRIYHLQGGKLS
jgi:ATP-binding cassette, subfamily C, bacterial